MVNSGESAIKVHGNLLMLLILKISSLFISVATILTKIKVNLGLITRMMYEPSFWEMESVFKHIDVCIIGSGIVGLNAAIHLKTKAPALRVVVVERSFLPYGASTRNAGFACFGSMTELLDDLEKESEAEVFSRVEMRWKGLHKLRNLLGDASFDYEPFGGYEVFTDADSDCYEKCRGRLDHFNGLMKSITGKSETYAHADEHIGNFGFSGVSHLIHNREEGQINSGKMMHMLVDITHKKGACIINGLGINEIKNGEADVELHCDNGFTFRAKRLLVANNGFAKKLLPELAVVPARAQVLITCPIEGLKIKGSFHYEKGYYYFRNVGNRLLFGGGRNLNFEKETTMEFGTTGQIQQKLEELLRNVIIPGTKFEVDMRWSGIMGMGSSKSTILKKVNGNIYCAVRMGGMGVAIGSHVGEQGAEMILQSM